MSHAALLNDSFENNPFHTGDAAEHDAVVVLSKQASVSAMDVDQASDSATSTQSKQVMLHELEDHRERVIMRLRQLAAAGAPSLRIFPAVHAGSVSRLQVLLATGIVSVNERDHNRSTPLHVAAGTGDDEMVTLLLSFGSDPRACDAKGRTARDLAHLNGHAYVARLLDAAARASSGVPNGSVLGLNLNLNLVDMPEGAQNDEMSPQASDMAQGDSHRRTFSGSANGSLATTPAAGPMRGVLGISAIGAEPLSTPTNAFPSAVIPVSNPDSDARNTSTDQQIGHSPQTPPPSAKPRYQPSRYSTVSDTVSVVICMVGLPGRGKSFISNHLRRYLNWKGVPCQVFNAGNYRRQILGALETGRADFFGDDPTSVAQRERMAELACEDVVQFLNNGAVSVAVLDATNTTRERRSKLIKFFHERTPNARVLWIESVCTKQEVIRENILRAKFGGEDFSNITDPNVVLDDFYKRIANYEHRYQTIDSVLEADLSYIRIIDVKETVQLHNVNGVIPARTAQFLLNLHPVAYPIYICRHAETASDVANVFGGDEELTKAGHLFAEALQAFVEERGYGSNTLTVLYASNSEATKATVAPLLQSIKTLPDLNVSFEKEERALSEINFGNFTLGTDASVLKQHPKSFQRVFNKPPTRISQVPPKAQVVVLPEPERINFCADAPNPTASPSTRGAAYCGHTPLTSPVPSSQQVMSRHKYPAYNEVYPRGESTRMVAVRCEDVILRISRASGPLLIVCPDTPARVLLSYLADIAPELAQHIRLPLHGVVEVGPKGDMTVNHLLSASPAFTALCARDT